MLGSVTDTLRKELRGNDNIGRWNDNSFIVMLPMTSAKSASRIFKRIYQSLLVPVDLHQYDVKINLDPHVGGGEYSNGITAQELIEKTIGALDQSKRDELILCMFGKCVVRFGFRKTTLINSSIFDTYKYNWFPLDLIINDYE